MKFLDTQRLSHLTKYLQELHSCQLANPDHTTLLLNCYTKLGDEQALSEFIRSSASNGRHAESGLDDATSRPFDVETSIRVCRQAGYFDHAVWLAKHYGEHQEYLRIQVEDRQDFAQALMYLCSRPEDEDRMIDNLVRYGQHLMDALPDETTRTLTDFCCGSFRSNPRASSRPHANGSETVTEEENATTDATIHRRRAELASSVRPLPSPRLFFALYINHPGHFIAFLEQLTERRWRKRITAGAVHGRGSLTKGHTAPSRQPLQLMRRTSRPFGARCSRSICSSPAKPAAWSVPTWNAKRSRCSSQTCRATTCRLY